MSVNEVVQGLGSWTVQLSEETPKEILDRLQYFGHIAIHTGRVNPDEYGDNLLTQARYVGVLTKRDSDQSTKLSGQSMELWLGDGDDKGEVFESAISINGQSFANSIRALLGSGTAVVEGTLHSVAGTYSGRHQWESRRKAIRYVCQIFNAEYRVNGNATLDAGTQAQLYRAAPVCAIVRKGAEGRDLDLTGLPGDMELSRDVEDFTTRVVLLAEGEGNTTATGSANISSNPYLDIRGNPIQRTRLISESATSTGNAQARAQLQLNRFTGTRNALRLSTTEFNIDIDGAFRPGDMVWVYDPDAGLLDLNNEITFRGQRINPIALRTVEASWPITEGMTVAYRHQDGSWIDLTDYVKFESGQTTIGVGELGRSLTSSEFEPVGPRPIPDSTIPGVVTWDLPFGSSVYLDALGNTRARILASWLLPLNGDGSTILDGSHYEIRYGLSPVTDEWQVEFAPWGSLQAVVNDLSPGVEYDFQIRAVDLHGNAGEWSDIETVVAQPDTIPPSTPAPPTVAGSLIAIQVVHELGKASGGTFNLELDLDHLEVHVGDSSGFTPSESTLKGKVMANAGMIMGEIPAVGTVDVAETTTRYVKVIAVDEAGNKSDPSTAATATAQLIDDAHISDLTVSKVTAGTISANWLLGASIRTASSGQRVELNSTGLHGYNNAGTELVAVQTNGIFFLRSATSGARLDFSNVTGIQLFNSGGTRTVHLDLDGSFELRSAASGARIQMDGTGFKAYNSSGQQTVDIAASTGSVTVVGSIATGFSGQRIVFNPPGATDPEIRFYPTSGSAFASIKSGEFTGLDLVGISLYSSFNPATGGDDRSQLGLHPHFCSLSYVRNVGINQQINGLTVDAAGISVAASGNSGAGASLSLGTNGSGSLIASSGFNFILNSASDLRVNGSPYKTFIIDHPVDPDRYLVHAATESPHSGVEYWGETTLNEDGQAVVELPGYFEALTLKEGRYVSVNTCSDGLRNASATYPEDGRFTIFGGPGLRVTWLVKAIRADASDMLVEPRRDQISVHGDGPYRYYTIKESHAL